MTDAKREAKRYVTREISAFFLPAVVATLPMCKDQLLLLCLLQLSQFSWAYLYSKEPLLLLFFVEWSRGRRTNVISYFL